MNSEHGPVDVSEADLTLGDDRTLHFYDTGAEDALAVFWLHGTPNLGPPPEPLFPSAARLGLRWLSYDRPGYGGSTPRPGRTVASAAADVAAIADAAGVGVFAVMGHSGGAPHALACGALLGQRVIGVVAGSGLAPRDASGLDWFAGMAATGAAELRAAQAGRRALEHHISEAVFDPELFTSADLATLAGEWAWLGGVAERGMESGPDGIVDDDVAYVSPWGFDPGGIVAPTLVIHGGQDRIVPSSHAEWLAAHIPGAELWLRPEAGHVSVLEAAEEALAWLASKDGTSGTGGDEDV